MTADMRAVLSEYCEDFYVIPRNGTHVGRLKMYGVFKYLLRDDNQTGNINFKCHGDEPKMIKERMNSLGFTRILDGNQRDWTVPNIVEEFTAEFKGLDYSLLLFCLYTHGKKMAT